MNHKLPSALMDKSSGHFTKAQILERQASELRVADNAILIPKELRTKKLKDKYVYLAEKLDELGIWSALDSDELKRYVIADSKYDDATAKIDKALKANDFDALKQLTTMQKEAFQQAHTLANSLCLNIISRTRVSRPAKDDTNERIIEM